MSAHVLPRFSLVNWRFCALAAVGTLLLGWSARTAAEPVSADGVDKRLPPIQIAQEVQRRPQGKAASQPAKPKDTAPQGEQKTEIPHVPDWIDQVAVFGGVSFVFLAFLIWFYVIVFRRLDTAAYLQRPSPRGVLYVPPEIEQVVNEQLRGKTVSPEERKKLIETYTLRYYFGGQEVICRESPEGLAVLAAGNEEVQSLLSKMTEEEKGRVRIEKPEMWGKGPVKM